VRESTLNVIEQQWCPITRNNDEMAMSSSDETADLYNVTTGHNNGIVTWSPAIGLMHWTGKRQR